MEEHFLNETQRNNAKSKGLIKLDYIKKKLPFNKRHYLKSEQSTPRSGDYICIHTSNKKMGKIYIKVA